MTTRASPPHVRIRSAFRLPPLRPVRTSAALTARFEGDDETALQEIMTRFREQLAKVHPDLEPNF